MPNRYFLSVICALLLVYCASAQRRTGGGSRVALQVRVVTEDGHPVNSTMRVQLITSTGERVTSAMTDDAGRLEFSALPAGDYQLEVSGEGYERATPGIFNIPADEHFHMETVTVNREVDAQKHAPAGTGKISAQTYNLPEDAKLEFRKGAEALAHNDLNESKKHFSNAIAAYPQYSAAYDGLGIVLARMGDLQQAQDMLQKAVRLDDHNTDASINLARLEYKTGAMDKAEATLQKGVTAQPANVNALYLLSNVQYRRKEFSEAVATEHKIHALPHATYAAAHLIAGHALEAQQLWQQARQEYALYLQEAPVGPGAAMAQRHLQELAKR